jgi:putative transposase
VQIDHTLVDVVVVDELERRPLRRPWLTLVIDVASRMVTGFYVSLDPPSTLSVALALAQAALPKDLWLCDRGLDLAWPACGLLEFLHLDNAPEFKSEALERGTREYGIKLLYRPIGRPHFGGHIERLIGTVMGAVHLLPGTTFASVTKRGTYESEKAAALTLPELERWLALQIAGVYHHSLHSVLHQPPALAWESGLGRRAGPVRHPQQRDRFFLDFLPIERRKIRRDGIRLFHLHYWHDILSPQAGRSDARALIRYDPRNLSRVYWQDLEGNYWPIPYRNLALPPISLWEHDEALSCLKAQGQSYLDEEKLMAMVFQQRSLVEQARSKTALRRRARQPTDEQSDLEVRARRRATAEMSFGGQLDRQEVESAEVAPFPVEIEG